MAGSSNDFLLSDFVDEAALKTQRDALLTYLSDLEEKAESVGTAFKNASTSLSLKNSSTKSILDDFNKLNTVAGSYTSKLKTLNTEIDKLNVSQKKQVQLDNEVIKGIILEDKATQQNIKTKKELLAYEQALEKEKAKGVSQAAAEARMAAELTNEYRLLGKSLVDAEIRYKNLALTIGFEAKETQEALQSALQIRDVLDKVDGNLRNYQRNVGNYKSAFDGLGMSFTQVARELPSLAINTQTFLLAISNNLPMVFDEIGKARAEINELRAQGEQAPSLFSRIAKSAFSLQVGLSVLVTLLTIFGPKLFEWIGGLFGAKKANDDAAESVKRLNQAQMTLIATTKELRELQQIAINGATQMEKELAVATALNKSRSDLLTLEKKLGEVRAANAKAALDAPTPDLRGAGGFAVRNGEEALRQYQAMLAKAGEVYTQSVRAQATIKDKDDAEFAQRAVERNKLEVELLKEKINTQKALIREYYDAVEADAAKVAEMESYRRAQALLLDVESTKIKAQARIEANERILADERNFADARIKALKAEAVERNKIVAANARAITADPKNRNADGTLTSEAKIAIKQASAERLKIAKDLAVAIFQVEEEYRKRRLSAERDAQQIELADRAKYSQEVLQSEAFGLDERLRALGEFMEASRQEIIADNDFQVATKVMTSEELLALEAATNSKLLALRKTTQKALSDIIVTNADQAQIKAEATRRLRIAQQEYENARTIKNKQKEAQANEDLEYKEARNSILNAMAKDEAIATSDKTTQEAKEKALLDYTNKAADLYKLDTDRFKTEQERKRAEIMKFFDTALQIFAIASNTVNGIFNAAADKQKNRIQDEIEAIDKRKNAEILANDARIQSDQDRAANALAINARAQAQKEDLERKQKQIDRDKAQREKILTVFTLTLELAKAIATLNPLKIFAAAGQLAVAIATPVPRFFRGKKKNEAYSGPAMINDHPDGRTMEVVERADGKIEMPGARNAIIDIGAGDTIHPDRAAFMRDMQRTALRDVRNIALGDQQGRAASMMAQAAQEQARLQRENQVLLRRIADKPSQLIRGTEQGMLNLLDYGANQLQYVEDTTRWG